MVFIEISDKSFSFSDLMKEKIIEIFMPFPKCFNVSNLVQGIKMKNSKFKIQFSTREIQNYYIIK